MRVSSEHAVVSWTGGHPQIRPNPGRPPKNGVYVDGWRLEDDEQAMLYDGSVVRLGDTVLVFRACLVGESEPSPPLGELHGPFGLWRLRREVSEVERMNPRTVLIEGPTGSGKELLARHLAGRLRPGKRYEAVNVAAYASDLFAAELFGNVRGAFTGADTAKQGAVRRCAGGALFLDEFAHLPAVHHRTLLRLLSEGEVQPIGGRPETVDVLLLLGSSRPLHQLEQPVLADLRYRIERPSVTVPALSERAEDLWSIASALAKRAGTPYDPSKVEPQAVERLMLHAWPGNVRELQKTLEVARGVCAPGQLTLEAVSRTLPRTIQPALTRAGIREAFRRAKGKEAAAASLIRARGLDTSTPGQDPTEPMRARLRRFIQEHGLAEQLRRA